MKKNIYWMFALSLLLSACGKEQAIAAATVERPASTIVVGALGDERSNVYSGEIRARYETVLGFRIGGKIIARTVDVGAVVNSGQLLARLDAADTGLQESAAAAQYRLADDEAKRYRELREQGFVSQSALDAKETALKAAAAQAGLARNQAAYTSLLSDRAGVVSATLAEVGQVVSAGQAVVRVAQDGKREVSISIPESRFNSVRVGMPAQIELSAAGNGAQTFAGHVREISPAADPASRTYPARVSLDSGNAAVALGMTARVKISAAGKSDAAGENAATGKGVARKDSAYLIPLSSIFQQGEKTAVWIVAADRSVSLRPVEVSAYRDDGALVLSGIAAGERIVSAGVHMLTAGDKIQLIDNGKVQ
jgi:multidrug efflux system membrane fusion protein